MEIINNFCSVYCLMSFILGGLFMLAMLAITAMDKESKSKVRFFVTRSDGTLLLLMKRWDSYSCIAAEQYFNLYGLSDFDFRNLEEGKRTEVFLNLED